MITRFKGKYRFLSNFYENPILYDELWYKNAESAFQSHKIRGWVSRRMLFEHLTALEAKKLGRKVTLRRDWERVKDTIMYEVVLAKFQINHLRTMLLETGDEELVEGNTWGDTYWGVCRGKGKNKLGHILMRVREEIREGKN
jgi:ribA/ribD-fused uncharacterized protein